MANVNENGDITGNVKKTALPLSCLNHISRTCSNLNKAESFYENVLGFRRIKRPGSFDFDGAWLFNYGIGIHLLQSCGIATDSEEKEIDPKSDHISFQCEDICMVEMTLQENGIKYVRRVVEEQGILVDQLFFHDPDGFMIEVCNCDLLPVVPLAQSPSFNLTKEPFFDSSCKRTSTSGFSSVTPLPVPDCV